MKQLKRASEGNDAETDHQISQSSLTALRPGRAEYSLWHDLLVPAAEADHVVDPVLLTYEQATTYPSTSEMTGISEDDLAAATLLANAFGQASEGHMHDPIQRYDSRTSLVSVEEGGEAEDAAAYMPEISTAPPFDAPRKLPNTLKVRDDSEEM